MLNKISQYISEVVYGREISVGGQKARWTKVKNLKAGVKIAVATDRKLEFDEIVSIRRVGREQVYDIEVEGSRNFVGNGILAHNTTGKALTILNETGDQNILTASQSGIPVFNLARVAGTAANGVTFTPAATTGTPALAATGSDTNIAFSVDGKGSGALNLNNTATGDILLGGGSGSTGCTVTNSTGSLTCSGAISTIATTGTQGWWSRTAGVLSPTNLNDAIAATTSATVAMTVTQTGAFNALLVEDAASDTTPFVIDQSGNVGIGTTAPVGKLTVQTDATNTYGLMAIGATSHNHLTFRNSASPTTDRWIQYLNGNDLRFYDSADRLTLQAGGNVGIGTTGPGQKLHVSGGYIALDNSQQIVFRNAANSAWLRTFDIDSADNLNIGRDDSIANIQLFGLTQFYDDVASPAVGISLNPVSGADSYFNSGNVGIGTTSPLAKLDVNGTASVSGALSLYGTPTIASTAMQTLTLGGTTTGNIQLSPGSATPSLTVTTAGNIGIGTTGPGQKLHLYQGASGLTPTGGGMTLESNTHQYLNFVAPANTQQGILFGGGGLNEASVRWEDGARGNYLAINVGGGLGINGATSIGSTYEAIRGPTNSLIVEGNVGIGTTAPDAALEINHATGDSLRLTYNDSNGSATNFTDFSLDSTGGLTLTGSAASVASGASAEKTFLTLTPANITLTGTTQVTALMDTYQFNRTTIAGDTATVTVDDAATLTIAGPPAEGTNVTLTEAYALKINTAATTATTAYGLYVDAPTGAGANYAAIFMGGNVGVGTTTLVNEFNVAGAATVSGSLALGVQSGPPVTCNAANEGRLFYHGTSVEKKLYYCNGTSWTALSSGIGGESSLAISPEYPGAVISADGTNNVGTLTSDREATGAGSLYNFNYYEFSSGQTSLQDYDVYVRFKIPDNFSSWVTSNALVVDFETEDTSSANNKVDATIYKDNDADTVASNTNVSNYATTWHSAQLGSQTLTFTAAQLNTGITWAAGDVMTIKLKLYSKDNYFARVGTIKLDWQ